MGSHGKKAAVTQDPIDQTPNPRAISFDEARQLVDNMLASDGIPDEARADLLDGITRAHGAISDQERRAAIRTSADAVASDLRHQTGTMPGFIAGLEQRERAAGVVDLGPMGLFNSRLSVIGMTAASLFMTVIAVGAWLSAHVMPAWLAIVVIVMALVQLWGVIAFYRDGIKSVRDSWLRLVQLFGMPVVQFILLAVAGMIFVH